MADRVLLALTSSSEGGPACLLEHEDTPVVARLVSQLAEDGEVAVVTWSAWAERVHAALPAGTVLHEVGASADAVRALVREGGRAGSQEGGRPGSDEGGRAGSNEGGRAGSNERGYGDVVLAHAHLVANDLALGRVADAAARGTAAVVGPLAAEGSPVRVTRGRIVAAGSAHHVIDHPGGVCQQVLRVGAGDRAEANRCLTELASLLEEWDDTDPETGPDGVRATASDAEPDLVASVLVALVRGGVGVSATGLPAGSVWRHPRTAAQLEAAVAATREIDEERQRLDAAVKADDGFFTTFFVSSYSRYWARWAARRGFTPNQVTSVSMVLGIAAALAFAVGSRVWAVVGALTLQLAFTLDCVDGQLARYGRRFSALGAWLDSVFDRGKEYVVYAGLAVGGIRAGDDAELWLLAAAALALQTFRHTLDLGYAEQQLADVDAAVRQPLRDRRERGPSFWEATPVTSAEPPTEPTASAEAPDPATGAAGAAALPAGTSLPRRVIGLLRRAEGIGVLRWAKRIVVLPIGERFALISVVAVVAGPRAVFLALLIWGGLATLYTAGGRVVRSVA